MKGFYITHMHGLAVHLKEFLVVENSADSYFGLALVHSVSYFFFFNQSPSLPLCTVLGSGSSSID